MWRSFRSSGTLRCAIPSFSSFSHPPHGRRNSKSNFVSHVCRRCMIAISPVPCRRSFPITFLRRWDREQRILLGSSSGFTVDAHSLHNSHRSFHLRPTLHEDHSPSTNSIVAGNRDTTPSPDPCASAPKGENLVSSSSNKLPTPAASAGGVDYSKRRQQEADAALDRQRTVQRSTDAQRRGEEPLPNTSSSNLSEEEKWWPHVNTNYSGRMFGTMLDPNKKRKDGMWVHEVKSVPKQDDPEQLSYSSEQFFDMPDLHMADEALESTKRFIPPPRFDPAVDDVEEDNFTDGQVMVDIQKALEEDKRRLEAFGNPLTVEDQVEYLLAPQREGDENVQQRQEFNGFTHWGLLHGAHMVIEENHDFKRAHEFVNRYMRDIDLFTRWLDHPKVRAHIQKKFGVDMEKKFDKLMALTMAMYTRSKIQVYEDDASGALKSLTACVNLISEGADMKNERHRKALGAVLVARGMVYCKLKSHERADDDLSRALAFVNAKRSATLFQLRAEAREALGRIEEARDDEVRAAEIWENAEVLHAGMDGAPRKFVV